MLSLPRTAYDRTLLCLFLVFLTLFWAFLSFQIHPSESPFRQILGLPAALIEAATSFLPCPDKEKALPGSVQNKALMQHPKIQRIHVFFCAFSAQLEGVRDHMARESA